MAFHRRTLGLRCKALSTLVVALASIGAAAAAELQPHRANYLLTMRRAESGSGISEVRGALMYEVAEACDGWTASHRMRLRVTHRTGREIEMESDFSSWETKDGTTFQFESRSRHNGKVIEEVSGRAVSPDPSKGGEVRYVKPKPRTAVLPPGTVFPVAHTRMVLDRAAAGEKLIWRLVFDGTTGNGLYGVNAFVGPAVAAQADAELPLFGGRRSWPLKLAYYPQGKDSPEPEFELAMRINEIGVSDDMVLDYGRFSLDARLKQIEALAKPAC